MTTEENFMIDGVKVDMAGVWDGNVLDTATSIVLAERKDVHWYAPYLGGDLGALTQFYRAMLLDARNLTTLIRQLAAADGLDPTMLEDEELRQEADARALRGEPYEAQAREAQAKAK